MPKIENKTTASVSSETPVNGTSFSVGGERPNASEVKRDAEISSMINFLSTKGLPSSPNPKVFREEVLALFSKRHLEKA